MNRICGSVCDDPGMRRYPGTAERPGLAGGTWQQSLAGTTNAARKRIKGRAHIVRLPGQTNDPLPDAKTLSANGLGVMARGYFALVRKATRHHFFALPIAVLRPVQAITSFMPPRLRRYTAPQSQQGLVRQPARRRGLQSWALAGTTGLHPVANAAVVR